MSNYHVPVLLNESIDGMQLHNEGIYVDVTFGGGGHSREILKRLQHGKLFAFDQDADAAHNKIDDDRFVLVHANFSYLKQYLQYYGAPQVHGILADLGVSSHQFDTAARGFSIRYDAPLDMRMNKGTNLTAAQVIATYGGERLQHMFSLYGEVTNAKSLAQAIVEARKVQTIATTFQLKEAIKSCVRTPNPNEYHAQVFQALRIEVNDEMRALQKFLSQSAEILFPGGRLVVISYHSLEDRMVKNFIRTGNVEGTVTKDLYGNTSKGMLTSITKKPIVPGVEEKKINNRARSAKMRIAEKDGKQI